MSRPNVRTGAGLKEALFYDDLDSGEGVVVRKMIDKNTALMRDGQEFDYNHSVLIDDMRCPKCFSNEKLVFKGDRPDLVSEGYVGACLECDEDFYLVELVAERAPGMSSEQFMEEVYEIAFGDNAINRDFDYKEVIDMLKEMSDAYADKQCNS